MAEAHTPGDGTTDDNFEQARRALRKEFDELHAEAEENLLHRAKKDTIPALTIIEGFANLEPGLILSHEQITRLRGEPSQRIMERIRERLCALIATEQMQQVLAVVPAMTEEDSRRDSKVRWEDLHSLRWIMENMPNPPITSERMQTLPAWLIGGLATEARCAIAEVCAELQVPIYKHPQLGDGDEAASPTGNEKQSEKKRRPINPDRDLPPGTVRLITEPGELRSYADVIGLDEAIERLRPSVLRLLHSDLAVTPTQHAILIGAHGVGKTLLAEALARDVIERQTLAGQTPIKFAHVRLQNVFYKWVGASNTNMNSLLQYLEDNAPIIAFMDEIEAALNDPSVAQMHEETLRVQNTMLEWMSGLQKRKDIFIIGATNRPELMHTGFLRGGRFGRAIEVPCPNVSSLSQMLKRRIDLFPIEKTYDTAIADGHLARHAFPSCEEANAFSGADIDVWAGHIEDALLLARDADASATITIDDALMGRCYKAVCTDREARRRKLAHAAADGHTCNVDSPFGQLFRQLQPHSTPTGEAKPAPKILIP
ncbi:hypothetical protein A3C37_03665 [Candidatus Peribacteria bacterium RIFCSPHIGHO2_02_FULL_53_20]|nr:MAG: hypothetical protein A3C37_03665 [Candidatus Peribacteria bacterium RIFCSPHIGHO2_02_FULL_53_20]